MGDPSLVPWFNVPGSEGISYSKILPMEATRLSISASPYDYIALSTEDRLIVARHADKFGQLYINDSPSIECPLWVVISTGP